MSTMYRRFLSSFVFLLVVFSAGNVRAATDVEFVLDLSGSMKQKIGAETKLESARKALVSALDELPKNQMVAVRVYGHRIDQAKKDESCKDTELVVPFQELNKQLIVSKISTLDAKGYTPIAYSLQETRNDLYDVGVAREAERVIILLTDGEETCGGDPVAVLKQLKAEGFKLTVFSIGFNVEEVARQQLKAIANVSGGKYFDAKDGIQLNKALQQAAQQSAQIAKTPKTYGNAIRGGDSYEDAKPIELDKEYKLDHHQIKGEYDYFYLDLDKASALNVHLTSGEKGIYGLKEGKPEESNNPYGGAQIHGQQRDMLKAVSIYGDKFKTADLDFRPTESGKFYLLIGNDSGDIHKDHFTFKLTKVSHGDLDGTKDAGESNEEALPMEAKRYAKNWLGDGDKIDLFSFEAKAGDKFFVGIVPSIKNQSYFKIRILDEFRQQSFEQSSQSEAGLKSSEFSIPDEGTHYLEITYYGSDPVPYALVLKKSVPLEGGAAPAASTEGAAN